MRRKEMARSAQGPLSVREPRSNAHLTFPVLTVSTCQQPLLLVCFYSPIVLPENPFPAPHPPLLSALCILQVCQSKILLCVLGSHAIPSANPNQCFSDITPSVELELGQRGMGTDPQTLPGKDSGPGYRNHDKRCQKLMNSAMRIMTHESPSIFSPNRLN